MLRRNSRAKQHTSTPADLLVVGLGNPGSKYAKTRHNIGVDVVELLAHRHGGALRTSKELALVDEIRIGPKRVVLAFPQTFMNESGQAVGLLTRRHNVDDPANVLVVHDELDIPVGRLKVKLGGGLAGHNGLKSIRDHLHTDAFGRIRVGVGRPPGQSRGADHVLKPPGKAERAELDIVVHEAADAVELVLAEGYEAAMTQYNVNK
jgi:PTH1 family peptidyl-tRNA hydrolase